MALIKNAKGSWFGLPDFGITESLTKNRSSQGGSNLIGPAPKAAAPAPKPQVLGSSTGGVMGPPGPPAGYKASSGGGMPSSVISQNQSQNQPYQAIQQQQNNGNDQIESDYNMSMSMLDQAQSGLQGQAAGASSQIENDAAGVRTSLGQAQATGEQGVQSSLSTAETQGKSAMQQARDLYRQTQQQNNAQLSALGISSSSVSEALAERLGVETARRIAGVTGSLDEVRQNATNELGRIKNYYSEKKVQLDENVRLQKDQIQQSLIQGLNQINNARGQAANAKAQARANLLSQVQDQIYQLTAQQQQFDQQLQAWAAQKSSALTPIAQDQNYLQKLIDTAGTFNKQFAPSGFTALPQVNYSQNGNMTGQVTFQKKPDEDPLAALYQQAGI